MEEPMEMGQALFATNTLSIEAPDFVEDGLRFIAQAIQAKRNDVSSLTSNGGEEDFACPVFTMRSYCWCDCDRPGHEKGCPPNFEHRSGLSISWYKYCGRGMSINAVVDERQWVEIVKDCLSAI